MAEDWTEARVVALLQARYPAPEWAFVHGLRTHVGYARPGRESYMDAFAMCCYPSKGLTRVAFEIKVSRSDWLAELRDPGKRKNAMRVSHQFWFVAPPKTIKKGEVPEGCGWMEATAGGLRVKRAARHREVDDPPQDFVASLLRGMVCEGRLNLHQAKAFRYAGRGLTVDEFLEATEADRQVAIQNGVRRRLHAAVRETPEFALGAAVRKAMGWPSWRLPTADDFRLWLESVQMGTSTNGAGAELGEMRAKLMALASAAGDLERKLNPVRAR